MPRVVSAGPAIGGVVRHMVISVETERPVELVDLTAQIAQAVEQSGVVEGLIMIQSRHTTAGLMINEHEPLLLADLELLFERLVPASIVYGHDDFTRRTVNLTPRERRNGHAHCRAALLRTSECLPITRGALTLGRWQRVFLVDFDGGQRRELWLTATGQSQRGS
jgi:secondary thiamine-phosphate synthase enzyme